MANHEPPCDHYPLGHTQSLYKIEVTIHGNRRPKLGAISLDTPALNQPTPAIASAPCLAYACQKREFSVSYDKYLPVFLFLFVEEFLFRPCRLKFPHSLVCNQRRRRMNLHPLRLTLLHLLKSWMSELFTLIEYSLWLSLLTAETFMKSLISMLRIP